MENQYRVHHSDRIYISDKNINIRLFIYYCCIHFIEDKLVNDGLHHADSRDNIPILTTYCLLVSAINLKQISLVVIIDPCIRVDYLIIKQKLR